MRGLENLFMGRLALKDRKIFFEYSRDFVKTGVIECESRLFDGLF